MAVLLARICPRRYSMFINTTRGKRVQKFLVTAAYSMPIYIDLTYNPLALAERHRPGGKNKRRRLGRPSASEITVRSDLVTAYLVL